ncbi:hypothetical protein [Algicola sagamiensis]|uniref:hypothetical protein n=1 Tax=Algicola sagamiensis TaxID=163869 RepID=UPI00036C03A0|nr:hypothetical protein [Algicola sagamiensis]
MKKLKYKALSIAVALSLGTLVGCGSDDDDKVSATSTVEFDKELNLLGSVVKGSIRDGMIVVKTISDKGEEKRIPFVAVGTADDKLKSVKTMQVDKGKESTVESTHMEELITASEAIKTDVDGAYSILLPKGTEGAIVVEISTDKEKKMGLIRCDSLDEKGCGGSSSDTEKLDEIKDKDGKDINPDPDGVIEFGEWYYDTAMLRSVTILPEAADDDSTDDSTDDSSFASRVAQAGPYRANCSIYTEMATDKLLKDAQKDDGAVSISADAIKKVGTTIVQQLFSGLLTDVDNLDDPVLLAMLDNIGSAAVMDLAAMDKVDVEISSVFLSVAMMSASLQAIAADSANNKTLGQLITDLNTLVVDGSINGASGETLLEQLNTAVATSKTNLGNALGSSPAGFLADIKALLEQVLAEIENFTPADLATQNNDVSTTVGCSDADSCSANTDGINNLFEPLINALNARKVVVDGAHTNLAAATNAHPLSYVFRLGQVISDIPSDAAELEKRQEAIRILGDYFSNEADNPLTPVAVQKSIVTVNSDTGAFEQADGVDETDSRTPINLTKIVEDLNKKVETMIMQVNILKVSVTGNSTLTTLESSLNTLQTAVKATMEKVAGYKTTLDEFKGASVGIGDGDQLDNTITLIDSSESLNKALDTKNTAASTAVTETETLSSGITTIAAALTFDQKATAVKTEVDSAVSDASDAVTAANAAKEAADALLAANPGNEAATTLVADADAAVTAANSADSTAKENQTKLDALLTKARAEVSEEQTKILNNTKLLSQGALLESKSVTDQMVDVFREAANAGSTNGAYADSTTVSGWEYKYDGAFNMEMRDKANATIRKLHMVGEISGTTSRAGLATTQVNFAFSATLNPPVADGVKFMVKNENDLTTAAGVTAALAECKTAMDAVIADPTKMIADTAKPKGSCAVVIYDGTITNASGIGQSAQVKSANFTRFDYADRGDDSSITATKMVDDAVVQHLGQNNSEAYVSAMGKITDKSDSSNEMSATLMMDGWYKKDVTLSSGAEGDIDKGTITIMDVDSTTEGDQTFVADYMMEEGTSRTVTGTVKYRDTSVGTFAESTTSGNLEISFSSISQTLVMAMDVFTTR